MKPPIKDIQHLMEEWCKDAPIDKTEPHKALERISKLHAKYLNILSYHRMAHTALNFSYKEKKGIMSQYYRGDLNDDPSALEALKLEPYPHKVRDISNLLDTDEFLNNILLKQSFHKEVMDYCSEVLKELNNQNWELQSIIKWRVYINDTTMPDI